MPSRFALAYVRTRFRLLGLLSPRLAARQAFRLFCTPQSRHRVDLPPIFEKAEPLTFSFEGNMIQGFRWNHPAPKKALLLHGHSSSATNFEGYVQPLIDRGYEVLAFDAPAHGRSSGQTITVIMYVNLILEVCRRYGPIRSFIAHSFGGLCLSLALERLPHDEETKVVLIAPAAETTTAIGHYYNIVKLPPRVRTAFEQEIRTLGGHGPEWYSVSRAIRGVKAQVLFLQDEEDRVTPVADLQALIRDHGPNIRFVLTRGLGHRRIYRDQESVKTVIGFISERVH